MRKINEPSKLDIDLKINQYFRGSVKRLIEFYLNWISDTNVEIERSVQGMNPFVQFH